MSILVWIMPDGSTYQGYPLSHYLADVVCHQTNRFFPGGYRLAYRLRVKEKE